METNVTESELRIPTEPELNVSSGRNITSVVGINVEALLRVASSAMDKEFPAKIQYWKSGSFNKVFLITFSDGCEVIARVPFPEYANPLRTSSEVATMSFASEHLDGIPVPQVYAWKPDSNNSVGAPYIIMEKLRGVPLKESEWFKLPWEKQMPILEALASFHAQLARPVPFDKIGNIFFSPPESKTKYTTGGLLPSLRWISKDSDPPLTIQPPSADPGELWLAIMHHEFEMARRRWRQNEDPVVIDKEEFRSGHAKTTGDFADVYRDLQVILGAYRPPSDLTTLCLWHGDIALRNVLFDMHSFTITGVLDWEDSAVMPLILTGQYPRELCDTGGWYSCPNDWLALGRPDQWGILGRYEVEENVDVTWARWYYGGHLGRKDARFTSEFWKQARLPLKLHGVVTLGWETWLHQQDWIHDMAAKAVSGLFFAR
ncbi:kinase-like domain-containing protein [Gautieria morchelliformis]|nr:kinase-like domain-containing protein [Gautieria morchelliformis]